MITCAYIEVRRRFRYWNMRP